MLRATSFCSHLSLPYTFFFKPPLNKLTHNKTSSSTQMKSKSFPSLSLSLTFPVSNTR